MLHYQKTKTDNTAEWHHIYTLNYTENITFKRAHTNPQPVTIATSTRTPPSKQQLPQNSRREKQLAAFQDHKHQNILPFQDHKYHLYILNKHKNQLATFQDHKYQGIPKLSNLTHTTLLKSDQLLAHLAMINLKKCSSYRSSQWNKHFNTHLNLGSNPQLIHTQEVQHRSLNFIQRQWQWE